MFNSFCSNLRAELNDLKTLKAEFDREYQQALTTGNMDLVQELRVILEQKRDNLAQKLFEWKRKWSLFNPRIIPSVENKENYWLVEKLERHNRWVFTLQVLPDGRIVAGYQDGMILIWDQAADEIWQFKGVGQHLDRQGKPVWVRTLQVLPDGRIVSGCDDGTIRIWDGQVTPKTKPAV